MKNLLHLSLVLVITVWLTKSTAACPSMCSCDTHQKIVHCAGRHLKKIPDQIPTDSLNIDLNSNEFEIHMLSRSNFSSYTAVRYLYLSQCGLESLEGSTFRDLANLKWLDLSKNRLTTIYDNTFYGLNLEQLYLNGNPNLNLRGVSFQGLSVLYLYLYNCNITSLSADVFGPLKSSLRSLWLNENALELIPAGFQEVLPSLKEVDFGGNPLRCNCKMNWFKKFFDMHSNKFIGDSPTCQSPKQFKGKRFANLPRTTEFHCQAESYRDQEQLHTDHGSTGPASSLLMIAICGVMFMCA